MAAGRMNDSRAFHEFLGDKLSSWETELTLDEALSLWECENQPDGERAATVRAVREALEDMRNGDIGITAKEAIAELRRQHNLPEVP